ncbi:hypothetical protein I9W82_003984 [Candida metapsilosis]|uniref:Uncharacterized protein n=1 Tax=Candida metapsilosis TaxID=273372 RepID=A0A8H7ZGJ8_9ASCO|nr:hypothetical protein I9W82_003984 [Candida metapsilosis]
MTSQILTVLSGESLQKLVNLIPPQQFKEVFPDIDLNKGIILNGLISFPQPPSNPIDNTTTQFDQGQDSIKMTTPPLATNPHLQSPNHFESDPVGFSSIDAIYDDDTYDSYPDGYYSVGILDAGGFHNSLLCPELKNQTKEGRFNTTGEFQMMMMNLDNQEAETDEEEDKNWIYNMSSNVEEGRDKHPQSVSDHSSHVLHIEPDLEETSGRKNDARDPFSALQKNNLPSQHEQHQQQPLNENNAVDEEETEDENVSIDSEADQFHVPYYEIDEAADSTVSLGQNNDGDGATEVEHNAASSSEIPINDPPTTTKKKKDIFKQLKCHFNGKLLKIVKRFKKQQNCDISSKVEEDRGTSSRLLSDNSSQLLQVEPDLVVTNGAENEVRDTLSSALQNTNLPSQQEHQQQLLNGTNAVDEEETENEDISIGREADQFHVPYNEIDEAADSTASLVEHGEDAGSAEVEENAVPTTSLVEDNNVNGATEVEENAASSSTENPTNNPPTTTAKKKKKNNIFTQLKYRFYLKLYQIRKRFRKPQYYDSDYDTEAREFYAYMRGQRPRVMYEYYTDDSESLDGR